MFLTFLNDPLVLKKATMAYKGIQTSEDNDKNQPIPKAHVGYLYVLL